MSTQMTVAIALLISDGSGEQGKVCEIIDDCEP